MTRPRERVPDTCCLCLQPNDGSAEDAVPRWLLKKFRDDNPGIEWVVQSGGGPPSPPSPAPRRVRTWYVCAKCNAFMNTNLEIPGRELLTSLIDGKAPLALSADDQRLVAGWVFKTSLMVGLVGWDEDYHPPDYALRHLRRTAEPPPSAYVWVGRLWEDDVRPGWNWKPGHGAWWRSASNGSVVVPSRTFVDTFVLGRLVAHIVVPDGIPMSVSRPLDTNFNDTMVRIWPARPESVEWPPEWDRVYAHLNRLQYRYVWSSRRGPGRVFRFPQAKRRLDRTS